MVLTETKYCTSFSNRLNALSPATTVECPRRLTKDQFLYKSCYPTDKPLQLTYLQLSCPKGVPTRPTDADNGRSDRTPDAEGRGFSLKHTQFSSPKLVDEYKMNHERALGRMGLSQKRILVVVYPFYF